MVTPIVSVVIPTHERAGYAVPTIRALLGLSAAIEVVVSDSSGQDLISSNFDSAIHAGQLKILRPMRKMSVVDNFNFALAAATGRYVCFIGDDDFVSSDIASLAKWAESNAIDAIKFTFPSLYFWPDFRHRVEGAAIAGSLRTSAYSGRISIHDSRKSARDALQNLGAGPLDMPRVYAGLVSRNLIEKITAKYGALFGGVSPDVYSALLIAVEAETCVKVDYPVVIPGASGASTAGLSAQGRHVGSLRDNPHISAFDNLLWDPRIPEFYSVPTVWGFSILKAAERAKIPSEDVGFGRLYLKCFVFQYPYWRDTLRATHATVIGDFSVLSVVRLLVDMAREVIWLAAQVIKRLQVRVRGQRDLAVKHDLSDTEEASRHLETIRSRLPLRLELN
jgi:hypothetical protein